MQHYRIMKLDTTPDPMAATISAPAHFPLPDFPPEIITHIAGFCTDHRLGLPTVALNTHLAAVLRRPSLIAARGLRRFKYPTSALIAECVRFPADVAVVRILLDELQRRGGIVTPDKLEVAAYRGDNDLLLLLLHRGAPGFDRALAAAAQKGHKATVAVLLAHRPKEDGFSTACETALKLACIYRHYGMVKMLLEAGATVTRDTIKELEMKGCDKAILEELQRESGLVVGIRPGASTFSWVIWSVMELSKSYVA
ncbi:hypothetical protein M427DRAFT_148013 [Gonapodya prolifera JEL478]|uniref:Uncharacterized protein n=1 Tax=Gonapodya prolifera (strain JEL478) TaxID=1344416 RepID=A0A139A338_GONPJ|nr:hypothetical protein M427DRAFT_148013 [Gonapodya prolifera JEL478]|eukprot:KXS11202.1 hypothetical protein M427DRAFT_148013 [Gonapodya prolifera JEL478]